MSELFKTGQILGRSEMKKIMAGSGGDGNKTNCVLCPWDSYCINFGAFNPEPPPPAGCSYGLCDC